MTEQLNKTIPTIIIELGEVLPPGARVLARLPDRSRLVRRPIKYQLVRDETGLITNWERKSREDFI